MPRRTPSDTDTWVLGLSEPAPAAKTDPPRDPDTGRFLPKSRDGWFEPGGHPGDRLDIEAQADLAVATMDDRAFVTAIAVRTFEAEAAACEDTLERLTAELEGRSRFLVFAAAAHAAGHHPAGAYCFVADRSDPAVTS